jgi:hypothetical protein
LDAISRDSLAVTDSVTLVDFLLFVLSVRRAYWDLPIVDEGVGEGGVLKEYNFLRARRACIQALSVRLWWRWLGLPGEGVAGKYFFAMADSRFNISTQAVI